MKETTEIIRGQLREMIDYCTKAKELMRADGFHVLLGIVDPDADSEAEVMAIANGESMSKILKGFIRGLHDACPPEVWESYRSELIKTIITMNVQVDPNRSEVNGEPAERYAGDMI